MLPDILRSGFALAHQRLTLVLLDVVWKIMWFIVTLVALYLAAAWIASDLLAISWNASSNRAVNTFMAMTLLREFWAARRAEIFTAVVLILMFSTMAWFLLEALFHGKMLASVAAVYDRRFSPEVTSAGGRRPPLQLHILLLSSVAKYSGLGAITLLMIPLTHADAVTIATVTLVSIGFLLTLFDSLIRVDAVDLLGADLFRVAALLGILMSLELMIGGSVTGLLLIGFLRTSRLSDAFVMLGATAAGVLLLNLMHSYLLLVRYSSIVIMSGANARAPARSQ